MLCCRARHVLVTPNNLFMVDSKSLHKKWSFHQTSIKQLLFRVPSCNVESEVERYLRPSVSLRSAWWARKKKPSFFVFSMLLFVLSCCFFSGLFVGLFCSGYLLFCVCFLVLVCFCGCLTFQVNRKMIFCDHQRLEIRMTNSTWAILHWACSVGGGWDNLKLFMLRCREIDSIWDCVWCWFEVSLRKTNFDTAKTIACTFPSTGVIWKHCHRSISYPRKQQQKRFFFECLHQTFSAIATSHEVRCLGPLHFINCNVWYYQCENADLLMLPMAGN